MQPHQEQISTRAVIIWAASTVAAVALALTIGFWVQPRGGPAPFVGGGEPPAPAEERYHVSTAKIPDATLTMKCDTTTGACVLSSTAGQTVTLPAPPEAVPGSAGRYKGSLVPTKTNTNANAMQIIVTDSQTAKIWVSTSCGPWVLITDH